MVWRVRYSTHTRSNRRGLSRAIALILYAAPMVGSALVVVPELPAKGRRRSCGNAAPLAGKGDGAWTAVETEGDEASVR